MSGPGLALARCPLIPSAGTSLASCARLCAVSLPLIPLEPKTGPGQRGEEKPVPSRPRTLSLTWDAGCLPPLVIALTWAE